MIRPAPLWPAARLNEELSRYDGAPVAFTPFGDAVPLSPFTSRHFRRSADGTWGFDEKPAAVAEILGMEVKGIETVETNISVMPPLLACCALDPEAWCTIIVHPGALERVGPFREVAAPFRDWLLRAARQGYWIGMQQITVSIEQKDWFPSRLPASGKSLPFVSSRASGLPVFPLPELMPTSDPAETAWLAEHLEAFDAERLGSGLISRDDAVALSAGVFQINGFLDRSHELAQSVEGRGQNRAGDYWHAIMHRREPDYSNAKYWFRRVGQHGIHLFLARDADDLLAACQSPDAPRWRSALVHEEGKKWNPLAFVDLCEHLASADDAELSLAARKLQLIEMVLLLMSTCADAIAYGR